MLPCSFYFSFMYEGTSPVTIENLSSGKHTYIIKPQGINCTRKRAIAIRFYI